MSVTAIISKVGSEPISILVNNSSPCTTHQRKGTCFNNVYFILFFFIYSIWIIFHNNQKSLRWKIWHIFIQYAHINLWINNAYSRFLYINTATLKCFLNNLRTLIVSNIVTHISIMYESFSYNIVLLRCSW